MATTRARNYQRNVVRQLQGSVSVAFASMFADAIKGSTQDLPNALKTMGQAMELRRMPRTRLQRVNEEIADKAQAAVVRGWRQRLPMNHPATTRKTRLHGHLGRALADPGNTSATTDRFISFINTDLMKSEARHWYRINYGAVGENLGKSKQQPRRFVMQLNGQAFASFRDELPPDPISFIPTRRYWKAGAMYPMKDPRTGKVEIEVNENGARAARFLDLGHAVVAREAPKAHDKLWREYVDEKGGLARQRLSKVGIQVRGDLRYQRTSWTARVRTNQW
jgi:hypothetical protein